MFVSNNYCYTNFRANPQPQKNKKEVSETEDLLLKTNPMTAPVYVTQKVFNKEMKPGEAISSIAASMSPLYSVYYVTQQAKNNDEISKTDAAKILAFNTMTNALD